MSLENFGKEQIGKLLLGLGCLVGFSFLFTSTLNKPVENGGDSLEREKKRSTQQIEDLRELRDKLATGDGEEGLENPGGSSKPFRDLYVEKLKQRQERKKGLGENTVEAETDKEALSPFQREVKAMDKMAQERAERGGMGQEEVKTISLPFLDKNSKKKAFTEDSSDSDVKKVDLRTPESEKAPFADLIAEINSKKPSEAAEARKKLVNALYQKIGSTDPSFSLVAGETFLAEVRPENREDLAFLLKDGEGNLLQKNYLIKALGKVGDETSVKALKFEYSHASDELIRQELVRAVGNIGHVSGEPFLNQILAGDLVQSEEIVKLVYAAFARIGSPSSKDRLFNLKGSLNKKTGQGEKEALVRAHNVVSGLVDFEAVDQGIPGGSTLNLRYKGTEYFFYHPAFRDAGMAKPWLLICVHGAQVRAEKLFELCLKASKNRNVAVLAPVFDHFTYPDFGFLDRSSTDLRPDIRFWEIVNHVAELAGIQTRELFIYGEEKGGDFVSRIVMDRPDRFSRAVAFNADYPRLTGKKLIPEGINPSPLLPEVNFDIYGFIKTDFLILTPTSKPSRTKSSFYKGLTREAIRKGYSMRVLTGETSGKKFGANAGLDYLFKNRPKGMKYQR